MTLRLERRQHPRFAIKSRAAVMLGRGRIRDIYHGDTCNLSIGGAGIFCKLQGYDETEEVVIFLFDLVPHLSIRARIRQAIALDTDNTSLLRVEFTGFCDGDSVRLATLLGN